MEWPMGMSAFRANIQRTRISAKQKNHTRLNMGEWTFALLLFCLYRIIHVNTITFIEVFWMLIFECDLATLNDFAIPYLRMYSSHFSLFLSIFFLYIHFWCSFCCCFCYQTLAKSAHFWKRFRCLDIRLVFIGNGMSS